MKTIAAGVIAASAFFAAAQPSNASTVVVGQTGQVTAGNAYAASTPSNQPNTSSYDDFFTFYSLSSFGIQFSSQTTSSNPGILSNVKYALYMGTVGSGTLIANITAIQDDDEGKNFRGKYKKGFLTAGNYYFESSGSAATSSSIGNTLNFTVVSAVPLPAAFPMFGAALLVLGGMALAKERKSSLGKGMQQAVA